jgi:hypothetical protein
MGDAKRHERRVRDRRNQEAGVSTSLISDDNVLDLAPSLAGFIAPTMQKLEQTLLLSIELLKGMALNPRNKRRYKPLRLAYLAPPAQIRTCGFPAYGSHLGCRRQ